MIVAGFIAYVYLCSGEKINLHIDNIFYPHGYYGNC